MNGRVNLRSAVVLLCIVIAKILSDVGMRILCISLLVTAWLVIVVPIVRRKKEKEYVNEDRREKQCI